MVCADYEVYGEIVVASESGAKIVFHPSPPELEGPWKSMTNFAKTDSIGGSHHVSNGVVVERTNLTLASPYEARQVDVR
jgi:hypothetical protein